MWAVRGLTGSVVFLCVFWYRNMSSEGADWVCLCVSYGIEMWVVRRLTGSVVFVCVFYGIEMWAVRGLTGSVASQEKNFSIDGRSVTHLSFCVQKCCNSERRLITKHGCQSKQRVAESPTALCLKQHKFRNMPISSVVYRNRIKVERWVIRNERKISPALKESTMNTAPVTTARKTW